MFDHAGLDGCCGFSIEILEVNPDGADICAAESFWILTLNPAINREGMFGVVDEIALNNLYIFDLLSLLDAQSFYQP